MRDDSTVRLNAVAAPDDVSSRTIALETVRLGATSPSPDDEPVADPAGEASTRAASRAAEEGHVPGPGLVIPSAARERPEPPPPDARSAGSPVSPPSDTGRASPPPPVASPSTQATRAIPTAHRPHRPVAAPSARPATPPRHAGPRPTGPGRPAVAGPAAGSPRTAAGPSRARTSTPRQPGKARRRAGGIAGGIALGLVAVVAASWTLLVPPTGHDERRAAAPARPAAPAVRWVRTNGDEFDGQALDRARWNVYDSVGGFGNGLRRPSAVAQAGGLLTVTARPRVNGGTSGGISMGKGQLHGRWEFRARADPGVGYSPAVLLWPDSERFPIDGELDMLESPQGDRRTASSYVHYGADNKTRGAEVSGDFTQWHTFAFEWLPDRLTWYVDGQKAWEVRDRAVIPTKPMHLCIQLDQGPAVKFMPGPDASTPDAVRMQVDWARQYRVG